MYLKVIPCIQYMLFVRKFHSSYTVWCLVFILAASVWVRFWHVGINLLLQELFNKIFMSKLGSNFFIFLPDILIFLPYWWHIHSHLKMSIDPTDCSLTSCCSDSSCSYIKPMLAADLSRSRPVKLQAVPAFGYTADAETSKLWRTEQTATKTNWERFRSNSLATRWRANAPDFVLQEGAEAARLKWFPLSSETGLKSQKVPLKLLLNWRNAKVLQLMHVNFIFLPKEITSVTQVFGACIMSRFEKLIIPLHCLCVVLLVGRSVVSSISISSLQPLLNQLLRC